MIHSLVLIISLALLLFAIIGIWNTLTDIFDWMFFGE